MFMKYTTNGDTWFIRSDEVNGNVSVENNGHTYYLCFNDEELDEVRDWCDWASEQGEEFKASLNSMHAYVANELNYEMF